MRSGIVIVAAISSLTVSSDAFAQRFSFERSFDSAGTLTLEVATERGRIDIVSGSGPTVVSGVATVRVGLAVPENAADLARAVAANPPVKLDGQVLTLRPPDDAAARAALTVSYRIVVPVDTTVLAVSDSGAIDIKSVAGPVTLRTQSGTIDAGDLGASAAVTSGSGAVTVRGAKGRVRIETKSSGIRADDVVGDLHVRTSSGAVEARMAGAGDANVQTGSSAVTLRDLQGGLVVVTQSGRVTLHGAPAREWHASTGSSAIDVALAPASTVTIDASSGSGDVRVEGFELQGELRKGKARGTIGGGGPALQLRTKSGTIRVAPADRSR